MNATIHPPELPVPIYIAAVGPVVARLAGERSDAITRTSSPLKMERLADALPVKRAVSRGHDADEAVRQVEAGFNHLSFHAPRPDQSRLLQLFAQQLAPSLRATFG